MRKVVLTNLDQAVKKKWIQFLIENDQIFFEPVSEGEEINYVCEIKLVESSRVQNKLVHRIQSALKSVLQRSAKDESLPPYSKFCALLAWKDDENVGSKEILFNENPKKHTEIWVSRKIDDIYRYKLNSLKDDSSSESFSYSNIFPIFVFEYFTKQYGLKTLFEQNSWEFLYSVHAHRRRNVKVELFANFLEEYYDGDDLLFLLHCRNVISNFKRNGFDAPFTSQREINHFIQLAFGEIKTLINNSGFEFESFPVDIWEVLRLAIESYHRIRLLEENHVNMNQKKNEDLLSLAENLEKTRSSSEIRKLQEKTNAD